MIDYDELSHDLVEEYFSLILCIEHHEERLHSLFNSKEVLDALDNTDDEKVEDLAILFKEMTNRVRIARQQVSNLSAEQYQLFETCMIDYLMGRYDDI